MTTLDMVRTSGLVPDKFQGDWFVAGGYAACPDRASDLDLWVKSNNPLTPDIDYLLKHLALTGCGFTDASGRKPNDPSEGNIPDYEGVEIRIAKVAVVTSWRGLPFPQPVHLLLTDGSLAGVLDNFDISTHQAAMLPGGQVIHGPGWTPLTECPRILMNENEKTAERFVKIERRYRDLRPSQSPCVGQE